MFGTKESINKIGISLAPGKFELVENQLGEITRSPNLVPQSGQSHETVWQHTLSMLDRNQKICQAYPPITRELNYYATMAGAFIHDIPEGFTVHGDLNYANVSHNEYDLRRGKELAEYSASHHFVERNIIDRSDKYRIHQFIDEWAVMESPLALYVRLIDMTDGNIAVINKALNLHHGIIQKVDGNRVTKIWPEEEVGQHISNIASAKTFPILEQLVHKLHRKSASLSLLHWFNQEMMQIYTVAGWGNLPVIQEMQAYLDKELEGFEL